MGQTKVGEQAWEQGGSGVSSDKGLGLLLLRRCLLRRFDEHVVDRCLIDRRTCVGGSDTGSGDGEVRDVPDPSPTRTLNPLLGIPSMMTKSQAGPILSVSDRSTR
jgi:hypothetical protein